MIDLQILLIQLINILNSIAEKEGSNLLLLMDTKLLPDLRLAIINLARLKI